MATEFDQADRCMMQQEKRIEQLQNERNRKYNQCMESYLNHLKKQIEQIDSTEEQNNERNAMISSAFENVYERIVTSSQVSLRKIKQTCFEKKRFWERLIQNNSSMPDLQLKKEFYQQKRDAEDRHNEAVESQKIKKISYNALLGKLKKKQNLREWQENNRKLEQKVEKGTKTMKQWKILNKKPEQKDQKYETDYYNFIPQFMQREPEQNLMKIHDGEGSFLNNFQMRRN